jgi:hypothetical protein
VLCCGLLVLVVQLALNLICLYPRNILNEPVTLLGNGGTEMNKTSQVLAFVEPYTYLHVYSRGGDGEVKSA